MILEDSVSRRIWIIRILMIIGIIYIHIPYDASLASSPAFLIFKDVISDGVFRAAVPVLTTLSGYLVFISSSDQHGFQFIQKKIRTLFIPLVIWNLPIVVFVYWLQKFGILNHAFSEQLYPFNLQAWMDGVFGLTQAPVNYPLNFIRDLFALALLAPILGILLRRMPYIGLVFILLVYWFNLDGLLILRESMLISFYLGGLIAINKWDVMAFDQYIWILFPVFIGLSFLIAYYGVEKIDLFRIVAPFMVWPAMKLIDSTVLGDFLHRNSRHSFFIYLSCGPMLFFMWYIYTQHLSGLAYEVFWFITPLLIIAVCILINCYFHRRFPKASGIVLGDR